MNNTYTLAIRTKLGDPYTPAEGIPRNLTMMQAQSLASQARANGVDAVAFNSEAV